MEKYFDKADGGIEEKTYNNAIEEINGFNS